jgi:hypothetical protein
MVLSIVFLQPGEHPVTLSDRFIQPGEREPRGTGHNRAVALAALAPVRRVLRFDDEVGAVEADRGTASRRIGRQLAATARGLGLKDAPSILAGMDTQIGLFEYDLYIVAPHLLAGAATEGSTAGGACGTSTSVSVSTRSIRLGTESVRSRRKLRRCTRVARPFDQLTTAAVEHQMLAHAVAPQVTQRFGVGESLGRNRDHVRNERDRIGVQVAADYPGAAAPLDRVQQRRVPGTATNECSLQRYQPAETIVKHRQ